MKKEKKNASGAAEGGKVKAPVHQRNKNGKKKQASKTKVKNALARLQSEVASSVGAQSAENAERTKKESAKKDAAKRSSAQKRANAPEKAKKNGGKGASESTEKLGGTQKSHKNKNKNSEKTNKNSLGKRKDTRSADKRGTQSSIKRDPSAKVRIIPLGGLEEIGKNITAVECGNDIVVIDCGFGFPDDDMLGVDLVIPDFTYLRENADKVRGIVLTHGHEDHIGGIPYLLREMNIPVYGTLLTLGIIKNKLAEHKLPFDAQLKVVSAGERIKLGESFEVEFVHVNHSIADACALCIDTPAGRLFHTGDFKLDLTPVDGEVMDISRICELGNEGIDLLMCESTNAERRGYTPSEREVGRSLEFIFSQNEDKRIVIATFSSNVHRVQQIIDTSARHGRKVAVTGRSMLNVVGAASELGYMNIPEGTLIDISEIKRYNPEQITVVTTGSQGEPMSALYRMAFSDHREVTLGANDVVVLSSSPIPGNEKLIGRIINELCKNGVTVLNDAIVSVHVSGHACREELKLMQALTKPRYFMPVHGESRHLVANKSIALEMGMDERDIFISTIGRVLEISRSGARFVGSVPAGKILVNGNSVGEVGNIVLRDRRHLSQDGLIVVVATVDMSAGLLTSGPDVVSRGFVYVRESEELMDDIRELAETSIEDYLERTSRPDRVALKTRVKDDISKYVWTRTKRRPMVLPIIMNV